MALTSVRFAVALDMPSRTRSARPATPFGLMSWVRRAAGAIAALVLAVSAPSAQEVHSVLPDGLAGDAPAPQPSAALPAPPAPLPDMALVVSGDGPGVPPAGGRPWPGRDGLRFTSSFTSRDLPVPLARGFSVRLMSRMSREALRFRRDNVSNAWGAPAGGALEETDSAAEAARSAEASRVVTRSLHRALDDELDRLARTTLGLGPALDFVQNLSLRRPGPRRAGEIDPGPAVAPSRGARAGGARADVGLRLDAHPALVFRGQYRSLRGRLELPARGEPARLSVESPVGRRGRAVLASGLPRDGQAWATLTLNFSF